MSLRYDMNALGDDGRCCPCSSTCRELRRLGVTRTHMKMIKPHAVEKDSEDMERKDDSPS